MKVLLFDIDGTLIRAGGAGRKALNRAGEILYGKKDCCSEISLAGRTDLYNFGAAHRFATQKKPTAAAVERLHQEYLKQLPRFVRAAINDGNYHIPAGLKVLLKRLSKDKRVLLGLGTGNMEKGARIKLEPSGFNPYFQFGGFGSDSFHRHLLLRKAITRAKKITTERFSKEDIFVIGDTPLDVAAGKKCRFKTIGVGTGFSDWKELVKSKPDHLARDFRGLEKWLSWFELS
ncbi:MAG TPA: HAD hydrolase-like protein [Elusimicrobiota bacterium]|nr:HAD hydrolase-like protein [Elusimicrobiota bacterium]